MPKEDNLTGLPKWRLLLGHRIVAGVPQCASNHPQTYLNHIAIA
jgi:hypothetical protein